MRVTALSVQEFDKGRGPVGFPPIGQACDLPVEPDGVLARVPLSNSGAAAQSDADALPALVAPGLGWLNQGWLSLLPVR
jgi:hypothetical protein